MNTAAVGLAVTPTVVSTFLSHYLDRKPLRYKPTAHLSYDEGLNLVRTFLDHASRHTVEELQAFTGQWVPHPQWVKVDEVEIPDDTLTRAAALLVDQLGPDGIRAVGGSNWWRWRKPNQPLKAEWIEMRSNYHERKKNNNPGTRVMLYVHGGAYFFGSVDEHRYQIQRHARKLKARAFAPRYRLAPQFPFPCGLQDCLAAYLFLLSVQDPSHIILAGDSAGGGAVLSLLVVLRDRGIPLPAGAVLISPWVDLTHSFPSVAGEAPLDYIPQAGFHHKPSMAWPPPNEEELEQLKKQAMGQKGSSTFSHESEANGAPSVNDVAGATTRLSVNIDGQDVEIKEQIQMYTTNELISHPLVSPVLQPTLGGLCPLLIMVGGGEILRDEQIYLAQKCANPKQYLPPEILMDDKAKSQVDCYEPTDVQLQVWEDLCHVAPTLSFTRPAKHMFRSISQFGAWALARAQKTGIEILDDDQISIISNSESETRDQDSGEHVKEKDETKVGIAGDPLPRFKNHMIRQRVTRHGNIFHLEPASELPGCTMSREEVGVVKARTVRKWLQQKRQWDTRFHQAKATVHQKRLQDIATGYEVFSEGDVPPPSALAGRRKIGGFKETGRKRARSLGLSLWSLWGSKHDEMTVQREEKAENRPAMQTASSAEGQGARDFVDLEEQKPHSRPPLSSSGSRSRSRRRVVRYESQVEEGPNINEDTPADALSALRNDAPAESSSSKHGFLTPNHVPDTGVTGKRPVLGGIAMPFTIAKEADTASMLTLTSAMDQEQPTPATKTASDDAKSPPYLSPLTSPVLERFVEAEEDGQARVEAQT